VQLGQWRLAVEDAETALKEETPTVHTQYCAARIYAQAAARVPMDPGQQNGAGRELARDYNRRAVELLRSVCRKTTPDERAQFWKDCVEADAALRLLARTPDFAGLRSEFLEQQENQP
jgi:hypothetical protein